MPETIQYLKTDNEHSRNHIPQHRRSGDGPPLRKYNLLRERAEPTQFKFGAVSDWHHQFGANISVDNAYKRYLCGAITGAMAFGYPNTNPPPEDHWAKRFWDIGRAEGTGREEMREALQGVVKRCANSGYVGVDGQYLKTINAVLAKYSPPNPA